MDVLISGAGLGGLSALGVGINILPHATRELVELGLADDLAAGSAWSPAAWPPATAGRSTRSIAASCK